MGRTGRQWNVISEPYPGLRGYATAYSWNPLRKGLLTGIYVLPNSSRFFSMRFTPLNSRIFLHLNPKSHLLSNLKGRRLQIYLRPFSWLILRLRTFPKPSHNAPDEIVNYDRRIPVEGGAFLAWGHLTYTRPLTEKEASDYELRPALVISELSRKNDDRPLSIVQQMKEAGALAEASRGDPVHKKKAPDRGDR